MRNQIYLAKVLDNSIAFYLVMNLFLFFGGGGVSMVV